MLTITNHIPCQTMLKEGLHTLARSSAAAYGNGGKLLGRDLGGHAVWTDKLGELLTKARMNDEKVEAVRALLADGALEDGMKTAVILADALLDQLEERSVPLSGLDQAVSFGVRQLQKLADNNNGVLVGGGLYLINLARPLAHMSEAENLPAAKALAQAVSAPLLALAAAAGFAPHEVYERVKAAAPNQFYSLHHFGLSASIPAESEFCDVVTFGLDICTGRIADLMDAGIIISVETGSAVLKKTAEIVENLYAAKSVLL